MKKYGKFVNIHIAIINRKKYLCIFIFIDKTCIQNIQIYCYNNIAFGLSAYAFAI